ncbi:peptidoglycan-binding domain-containing protein [Streptomyces sp. NPDC002742]|uniref:peptidoglycan-binding domain-containing protein n=1 Tax=unclassified Streptomyces TaxID=2593676 RepID=UPI00341A188F
MRSHVLGRTIVSLTAIAGIAAGTLAAAGTGYAAPAPTAQPVVGAPAAALATENFGLTTAGAMNVQRFLASDWGYTGKIDGLLGTESWEAFQRYLKKYYGYTGNIDGDPGTNTIMALQRLLKEYYGYTGKIDGVAGTETRAAFKRFAGG